MLEFIDLNLILNIVLALFAFIFALVIFAFVWGAIIIFIQGFMRG